MTVHQHIKAKLRHAGLTRRQCAAVIATAKVHESCALASGWWNDPISRHPNAGDQLTLNVTRLALVWMRAFAGNEYPKIDVLEVMRVETSKTLQAA